MNLPDEDHRTTIAVLRTHAEHQDLAAVKLTEKLSTMRINNRNDPNIEGLTEEVEELMVDADNLRRIAGIFEEGLNEPAIIVAE